MRKEHIAKRINIITLFLFFIIIEWRWQVELLGYIPPNPYYLVAILCCVVTLVFTMALLSLKKRISILAMSIVGMMIYCFIIFIINISDIMLFDSSLVILELGVWTINFGLFFIALDESLWTKIERHSYAVALIFILFILTPMYLLMFSGRAAEANYSLRDLVYILGISENVNHGVAYQSYGDKIVLLSFLMLVLFKSKFIKIAVFCSTITLLYVVGSKAGLIGFLFAIISYFIINSYKQKKKIKLVMLVLVITFIGFGSGINIINNVNYQGSKNWIVQSLASGKKDSSLSSRKAIYDMNIQTLYSRFFIGDYKFDLKMGRPGSYTHNVITFLDYYGVFVFVSFILLWCYLLFKLLEYKGNKILVVDYSVLSMLFYSLLFLVARSGQGYLTYWTLGCAVTAGNLIKRDKNMSIPKNRN